MEQYSNDYRGKDWFKDDLEKGQALKLIIDAFGSELILIFIPSNRVSPRL
jgi:hypothetical protein